MFFTIDDLIELNDKNYLVQKVALIDNEAYYEVEESDKETSELLSNKLIVKGVNEDGTLYIEEINDKKLLTEINKSFE